MKKNGLFLVTSLFVLLFWQWAFYQLKGHYSGMHEARRQIAQLRLDLAHADVRAEVVQYKFDLFRQDVAKAIPTLNIDPLQRDGARSIASVVQAPPEEFLALAQVESSIENLRALFEKRRYKEVIQKAKNILSLNPVSTNLVSVYFMLSESYYQNNQFEACMETAQIMTRQFPENDKTGYVLLRVGLFLKEKNRIEEAQNMFSLVAHAFAQEKELKEQAEKLLANLGGVQ